MKNVNLFFDDFDDCQTTPPWLGMN